MSKVSDLPMSEPPERERPQAETLGVDGARADSVRTEAASECDAAPVSSPVSLRDFFASDPPPAARSSVAPENARSDLARSDDVLPESEPMRSADPEHELFVSEPTSSDAPFGRRSAGSPAGGVPPSVRRRHPSGPRPEGSRRRRRPWLLIAGAAAAGVRICGGEVTSDPEATTTTAPAVRQLAQSAPFTFDVDGPFTATTVGSAAALLASKSGALSAASPLLLDRGARKPLGAAATRPEAENVAKALESFELTARPVVPGRTWQESANAADWPAVALSIDALPAAEQAQSGARYARAVAAQELGQCHVALRVLDGLDSELPLLATEIASLRARCQLEVGPYEEAYRYYNEDQTPENLTLAARAAAKGGDLVLAEQTIERALSKLRKQDGRRAQQKEIAARIVRAGILEQRGLPGVAARDWLWMATEAPTDPASSGADDTYERLAGVQLGSTPRLERLRAFARDGQLERTLREYARLGSAPGPAPERADVSSALAWAYYHSRSDYQKAAELFREAAALSADARIKFLFFEARALERANDFDRSLAAYRELTRRYPGGPYTEQAVYRSARIEYGRGRWEAAEQAYSEYLDRYARNGGGKYASASRYELAISRIGAKQRTEEAAQTLGQLARKERRSSRRATLTELEAVALELTHEPSKVQEAISRYRAIMDELPLSFAARASAARLRALGADPGNGLGQRPAFDPSFTEAGRLPEKAQFLADIGLHTDAERALFDARQAAHVRDADMSEQALCGMYGALDRGYRSLAIAERLLKRDDFGRLPSTDNVWAWRCKYPQPYRDIVSAVEARYHLPPSLVHAVMRQESNFRPAVVSPVGAIGLMQLMPYTATRAAEEIMQQPGAPWVPDPRQPTNVLNNVELGGFYLGKLLSMLEHQLPVAVAAYNAGPKVVSSWLAGGEDLPIDVWVARIPFAETRDYVSIVVGNWLAYRYLDNPTELPELELALVPGTRAAPDAY
jgi:soluble lytic murein transglycosylase